MIILVVDNNIERRNSTVNCLSETVPSAQVRAESDPYEAGKYCLFNPVDIVFTELEPGEMDALHLEGLIHHTNPSAKIYITGRLQSLYDWEIIDENNELITDNICGALSYPVTAEKLSAIMKGDIDR